MFVWQNYYLVVTTITPGHHAVCYQPGELLPKLLRVQKLDMARSIRDLFSSSRASTFRKFEVWIWLKNLFRDKFNYLKRFKTFLHHQGLNENLILIAQFLALIFLSVMVLFENIIASLTGEEQIPVWLKLNIGHFVCGNGSPLENTFWIVSHKVPGVEAYLYVLRQRKLLSEASHTL